MTTTLMPAAETGFGFWAAIAATSARAMLMTVSRTDRGRDARWAPLGVTGNSLASSLPEQPKAHGLTEGWCRPRQDARGQRQGRDMDARADATHPRGKADRLGTIQGDQGTPEADRLLPWGAAFFCWALSTVVAWERRQYASRVQA